MGRSPDSADPDEPEASSAARVPSMRAAGQEVMRSERTVSNLVEAKRGVVVGPVSTIVCLLRYDFT